MEKREQVLQYIKEVYKKTGFVPSKNEISTRFGIAMGGTINRFFNKLAEDKLIIAQEGGTGYLPVDYKELLGAGSGTFTVDDLKSLADQIESLEKELAESKHENELLNLSMTDSQRKLHTLQEQNRQRQRDYKERKRMNKKAKAK